MFGMTLLRNVNKTCLNRRNKATVLQLARVTEICFTIWSSTMPKPIHRRTPPLWNLYLQWTLLTKRT